MLRMVPTFVSAHSAHLKILRFLIGGSCHQKMIFVFSFFVTVALIASILLYLVDAAKGKLCDILMA